MSNTIFVDNNLGFQKGNFSEMLSKCFHLQPLICSMDLAMDNFKIPFCLKVCCVGGVFHFYFRVWVF